VNENTVVLKESRREQPWFKALVCVYSL